MTIFFQKRRKCTLIFCLLLTLSLMFSSTVCFGAEGEPDATALYSLSACLMDADSGRILYEKDGDTLRANASTTKILTCILALEYGNLDDYVSVSKYAASMPDVQLNMNTGEQYRLGDLLYSLMLESHNDTAVAIAEHIGGSVEEFAAMMNEKAEEIGCTNSHFITPNGLDATETIDGTDYIHGTTAADLCRIMAYCIQNEQFLEITQTASYTFTNYVTGDDGNTVAGARSFTVNNKNAFLSMMDGVISGKTGFTGNAGYCYVTALKRDERTFTVALLGCGWPNNKTYKWQDATLLLNYGLDYFQKQDFFDYKNVLPKIAVEDGIVSSVSLQMKQSPLVMLARADDVLQISYDYPRTLTAPVYAGDLIGTATYTLNGEVIQRYNLYAGETVAPYDFSYCFGKVLHRFLQF